MADIDPTAGSTPTAGKAPKNVKARHYIEAGLAWMMMNGFKRLNLRAASNLGGWLARTLGPLSKPWQIARRNVARAMPEASMAEQRKIVRDAFDNFGRSMVEYSHLRQLWRRRWDGIIDVQGDGLAWAIQDRRPSIVFTAHIGNWELAPLVLAARGKPALLVYRAPNNPLVDTMIANVRSQYAAGLAPKGADGLRQIISHLQDGGTVYMVVDQKTNTGPAIPFFGRGAHTGKAIARIAMKYGCQLIPAHCERVDGSRFRITFEPPWKIEGNASDENDVYSALSRINTKIEDWVRASPGQWMWMHKRWPD